MVDILTEFCLRLNCSRYNSAYRVKVIYSAVTGLQEAAGPGGQGQRSLHWLREWEAEARWRKKPKFLEAVDRRRQIAYQ